MSRKAFFRALACTGMWAATACIPYTVGTTAQPVSRGEASTSLSSFVMPPVGLLDTSRAVSYLAADVEWRWGLDERSDLGVRIPSFSGLVFNYKRLISSAESRTRVAIMPGAGFVNLGNHAHFELTLLVSGYEEAPNRRARIPADGNPMANFVPYGGLRVMQVAPLAPGQVHDRPTAGGFIGLRIGSTDFGISPEIGVFYDHSALGVRSSDVVFVPAVTVHGDELVDFIRSGGRPRRRGR